MNEKSIHTLGKVFKELNYILTSKQKKEAGIVLVMILISSFFELLGVSAVLPFINIVVDPDKMMANKYVEKLSTLFKISTPKELLVITGIGIILIYIVKNICILISNYYQSKYAAQIQKELSIQMLKSYMERPYTYFINTNSAEIVRGCDSDVMGVYNILNAIFTLLIECLTMTFMAFYIIYIDWKTAVSVLILVFSIMIIIINILKPAVKKIGIKNRHFQTMKHKAIYQTIMGIKEIFVMQRKKLFLDEYEEIAEATQNIQKKYAFISSCPDRVIEGTCVSGLIGIVCLRLVLELNMAEFIPKLAAFAMVAFRVLPSVGKIASRMTNIIYYRPRLANCYKIISKAEEQKDIEHKNLYKEGITKIAYADVNFEKELEIRHVKWKYEGQPSYVLTDANLKIQKGECIAFIGVSGAGKTTLSDIILGLLHPEEGEILMDGMDIFAMPERWASIVGYVPQTVYLLDDTIRNNISFGLMKDEIEDKKIWEALEKSQLKSFVEKLPLKLDTIVGERGIKFSGGQRQRIAIARALYNEPDILLLDEATASLDNETETAVMESINVLQGKITMIIIAHRLTTIRNCDRIYEIADGRAIEKNKAEVLLNSRD